MATTLQDLLPLLARIAAERDEAVVLGDLAEEAGRSASYFQRAFRRIVGESPKHYDRRLRLEWAAVLLLTSRDSVLGVALEVGFHSHEGFTRAFHDHFGIPPKDFRKRGLVSDADAETLARHAEMVRHLGPCLGLYRVELHPKPHRRPRHGAPMSYDITQKKLDAQPILYRAAKCEQAAIAQTLAECLPSIAMYAGKAGIAMMGPPFTRYVSFGPGLVSLEAGMPVAPGSAGEGDILVGELPAGNAAVTIHTGSYDGLGDAHAAVEKWIGEQGLEVAGPPWEVYITDPGEVPNPDEWKTEIVWPVKG